MSSVRGALCIGRKKVVTSEKRNEILPLIEAMPTISSHHLASQVQIPHNAYYAMQETKFAYFIHTFSRTETA